jgi:hypothetical protein
MLTIHDAICIILVILIAGGLAWLITILTIIHIVGPGER